MSIIFIIEMKIAFYFKALLLFISKIFNEINNNYSSDIYVDIYEQLYVLYF